MSLHIQNLCKQYNQQRAVDNISFQVGRGEVVGFLGPNGAGKSTTMKIITGYLVPTDGRVTVSGLDVVEQSLQVRKRIGYLPEHNPLYADMYVHEYLRFCGKVFGMRGSALLSRIGEVIELCGLQVEQHKRIESLSKGYRQRVGLAQAMLHNPEVLILDEPTTGLDPNQLQEIRKLIKSISQNKTVLLSTHIMQEVHAVCHRAIVINKGKIVADDTVGNLLQSGTDRKTITVEFDRPIDIQAILKINGVQNVLTTGEKIYNIDCARGADVRPELFKFASEMNVSLIGLRIEEQSLEAVFKQLTAETPSEVN